MEKKLFFWLALALLSCPLVPSGPVVAATPDFVSLAEALKPAVVNISTEKTIRPRRPTMPGPGSPYDRFFDEFFEHFFGDQPDRPRKQRSLGSGFVISADGYILTNDHVVKGAEEVKVTLADGRVFEAVIRGSDEKLDLALLKIEVDEDLPATRLGDSDKSRVGEWVMAIGNPFGLEQTVTVGIVSAKGRVIGAGPYDDFIQTDASINPGNSGGPLFNSRGEVIGINTAIVAGGQGIGFAIPVNAARNVILQLREVGHVTRGWLGVSVQEVSRELARSFGLEEAEGALVAEVIKDSPGEKAGLKRGDIILSFDGEKIGTMHDLPRMVAATPVGKKAEVIVFRDGRRKKVVVEIGRMEAEGGPAKAVGEADSLGLTVAVLTPELSRQFGLEAERGVVINAISPDGPAADSNLRAGDLILEIDGVEIAGIVDFNRAVREVKPGQVLRLLVQRRENLLYTTLKAE